MVWAVCSSLAQILLHAGLLLVDLEVGELLTVYGEGVAQSSGQVWRAEIE